MSLSKQNWVVIILLFFSVPGISQADRSDSAAIIRIKNNLNLVYDEYRPDFYLDLGYLYIKINPDSARYYLDMYFKIRDSTENELIHNRLILKGNGPLLQHVIWKYGGGNSISLVLFLFIVACFLILIAIGILWLRNQALHRKAETNRRKMVEGQLIIQKVSGEKIQAELK